MSAVAASAQPAAGAWIQASRPSRAWFPRCLTILALPAALALGGCARPTQSADPALAPLGSYSGRLALAVQSEPPQSFSAGFDLRGNAATGELILATPIGSTLAQINWAPGSAVLKSGSDTRSFATLDALLENVTGAAVPVTALFDWLRGRDAAVPGWQPDLSRWSDGRLSAHRATPQPAVDLRVVLDQP